MEISLKKLKKKYNTYQKNVFEKIIIVITGQRHMGSDR